MSPFITLDQLRGIVGDSQLAGIDTEYNQQGIVDATNAEIGLYVVAQIGTAELAPAGYLMLRQAAADLVFYRLKGDGVGTESPTRQRADDALKLFPRRPRGQHRHVQADPADHPGRRRPLHPRGRKRRPVGRLRPALGLVSHPKRRRQF